MLHTMINKYLKYVDTVANNSFDYFEDNIFISNNGYNKFFRRLQLIVLLLLNQNNLPYM